MKIVNMTEQNIAKQLGEKLRKTGEYSDENCYAIAFHMTDWLDDMIKIVKLFESIDDSSPDEIEKILVLFLAHVPEHVAAAAKIMTGQGITDVFKVGSIGEEE